MGNLRNAFRLSARRDALEARLLAQEFRSLLSDDIFTDGETDLRSRISETDFELAAFDRQRHRR